MPEPDSELRRGNIGDHSEFLAFCSVIFQGHLDLTDPSGETKRGRLDVLEVSREGFGQHEKKSRGKLGALVRKAYFVDGEDVMVRNDSDKISRRLCSRSEISPLVSGLRDDLISWSQAGAGKGRSLGSTGSAAQDHLSECANKLMGLLEVGGLKAPSISKSDLYITFRQPNGTAVTQGFSVKSLMGSNSCLINHSGATLVTFEISNCSRQRAFDLEDEYCREVIVATRRKRGACPNKVKLGPSTMIPALCRAKDVFVRFHSIPNDVFRRNLIGIDTGLPDMLAQVLLLRFLTGESRLTKIVKLPAASVTMVKLGHPQADAVRTLERKIKDLFQRYAQGMNSAEPWDDLTEVKGGWVLVIKEGSVSGYCFEDNDDFRKYLFDNTYIDTPDVKRVPLSKREIGAFVGRPYEIDGKVFIDLSLIVKFSKTSLAFSEGS